MNLEDRLAVGDVWMYIVGTEIPVIHATDTKSILANKSMSY